MPGGWIEALPLEIGVKWHEVKIEIEIVTALPKKFRTRHFAA